MYDFSYNKASKAEICTSDVIVAIISKMKELYYISQLYIQNAQPILAGLECLYLSVAQGLLITETGTLQTRQSAHMKASIIL